jgi:hypothetical protein
MGLGLSALSLLVLAACGGTTTTRAASPPHLRRHRPSPAKLKHEGSQYCTEDWNTNTLNPSQPSAASQYGQFLTIYPKIRIYEIPQHGPGAHPAFTCALIAATGAGQISDVYANTFNGNGWHLDRTDAQSMQVNGVAAAYPPNASITASGEVRLNPRSGGHAATPLKGSCGNFRLGYNAQTPTSVRVKGGVSCDEAIAVLHKWFSKDNGAKSTGGNALVLPNGWECEAMTAQNGGGCLLHGERIDYRFKT